MQEPAMPEGLVVIRQDCCSLSGTFFCPEWIAPHDLLICERVAVHKTTLLAATYYACLEKHHLSRPGFACRQ